MKKLYIVFSLIVFVIFTYSLSNAEDDPWSGIYKYTKWVKSLGGYTVHDTYTVKIFKGKKGYDVDVYTPSLAFLELGCSVSKSEKNLICFPLHRKASKINIYKEEVMQIGKNKNNQIGFKFSDELKEKFNKISPDLANINDKDFLFTKLE